MLNQFSALLLSLIIEVPIVWWLNGSLFASKTRQIDEYRTIEIIIIAICSTVLTHPWVWWLNVFLAPHLSFVWRSISVEMGAIIVEAIVYRVSLQLAWQKAIGISLSANLLSFSLGLAIVKLLLYFT